MSASGTLRVNGKPESAVTVADANERHSLVRPARALADSHLLVEAPEQAQRLMDSVRVQEP